MLWLNRSPIPVGRWGALYSSYDFYMPSLRLQEVGGGGVGTLWANCCLPTDPDWNQHTRVNFLGWCGLKGVWHEIFYFKFFLWISVPLISQDTGGEGGGTHSDPGSGDAAGQGGTFRTRVQLCGHHPLQIYGIISGSIPKGLSLEMEMSYLLLISWKE